MLGERDRIFKLSALTRKLKTTEHGAKPGETETLLCLVPSLAAASR